MSEFQKQMNEIKTESAKIGGDLQDLEGFIAKCEKEKETNALFFITYENESLNEIALNLVNGCKDRLVGSVSELKELKEKFLSRQKNLETSEEAIKNMDSYIEATKRMYAYLEPLPEYRKILREKVAIALEINSSSLQKEKEERSNSDSSSVGEIPDSLESLFLSPSIPEDQKKFEFSFIDSPIERKDIASQ